MARGKAKGSPKTGGRQKGTPNKATKAVRNILTTTIEDYVNSETFKQDFLALDAKDRLLLTTKFAEYVIPKLQSTSLDMTITNQKTIEDQLSELAEDED